MNKGGYVSEETMVLRRWESVIVLFSIINRVGNVSSVSPSSFALTKG